MMSMISSAERAMASGQGAWCPAAWTARARCGPAFQCMHHLRLVERVGFLHSAFIFRQRGELAVESVQGGQVRLVEFLHGDDAIARQLVRSEQLVELDVHREAVLVLRL